MRKISTALALALIVPFASIVPAAAQSIDCTTPAPVAQTDQVKCWDVDGVEITCAGSGHDGDLQFGVASPSPRFIDNGDRTVTDERTGLIWLRKAICYNMPNTDSNGQATWQQALDAAAALADGTCGLRDGSLAGDWRLPNIRELLSLTTFAKTSPALAADHPFTGNRALSDQQFWSSTTDSYGTLSAWLLDLRNPRTSTGIKSGLNNVWTVRGSSSGGGCVPPAPLPQTGQTSCWDASGASTPCSGTGHDGDLRSGIALPSPRFVDQADGTVLDELTGLVWLQDASCPDLPGTGTTGEADWETALAATAALAAGTCALTDGSVAGDWRLPNMRELESLVNYEYANKALSNAAGDGQASSNDPFKGVGSSTLYRWSSDTLKAGKLSAFILSLTRGNQDIYRKTSVGTTIHVWPVRGGSVEADLTISKSDAATEATPGSTVDYTIVLGNDGPFGVTLAAINDTFPATLSGVSWTCVPGGGASCSAGPVSGDLIDSASLPAGATVTYTATATIDSGAAGTLENTATVTPWVNTYDPDSSDNSATDIDTYALEADLWVTKTDDVAGVRPGDSITYTIIAGNSGPSDVVGAVVGDAFSSSLTTVSWTCVAQGGASCSAGPVSGDISDTADLPASATATYTVTATVAGTATGTLVNTASVSAPVAVTDPDSSNDSATDTDTVILDADLTITKTDGATSTLPGASITYTIVVGNDGPSEAIGATVGDSFSSSLTGVSWTCVATGGAACSAGPVSGNIADTVNLPVGGIATYTVNATVDIAATGTLVNTASVSAPVAVTDPDSSNDSATDTDQIVDPAPIIFIDGFESGDLSAW